MSHNPNTVKSQDDLSTTNDGKRSSYVLLSTIEELEKVKKENKELKRLVELYNKGLLIIGWLSLIGILMELKK